MSGDAVLVVADTLRGHRLVITGYRSQPMCCSCQEGCSRNGHMLTMDADEHPEHVASAVVDALGGLEREVSQATRQCSYPGSDGPCVGKHHGRWVSGWSPEDAQP